MWARIEGDEVVGVIRNGLNARIPSRTTPEDYRVLGNLALLDISERKELGVYEVVEGPQIDGRFYAATYTRYEIDHERAQVIAHNELSPQPKERILKFRFEELREIREERQKNLTIDFRITSTQMFNGHQHTYGYSVTLPVNQEMMTRLSIVREIRTSGTSHYYEDVEGVMHRIGGDELAVLNHQVAALWERH